MGDTVYWQAGRLLAGYLLVLVSVILYIAYLHVLTLRQCLLQPRPLMYDIQERRGPGQLQA